MTTISIFELSGELLDDYTDRAMGHHTWPATGDGKFRPTTEPAHILLVVERMTTVLRHSVEGQPDMWQARAIGSDRFAGSRKFDEAVCRALVLHVFGETVEVPGEMAPPADGCDDLF